IKLAQCGPATKSKITIFDRRQAQVKEAMAHFDKALGLWKNGAAVQNMPKSIDDNQREARVAVMTAHAAEALMSKGDQLYEQLLAMKIPTGLNFNPKMKKEQEASIKKFKGWMESKTKKLLETQKLFQNVILFKNAHWAIAAAARIGQLFQDFANGLFTAEV